MLIEIDRSAIDDAIGHGATAGKSLECIGNLLGAHRAGKHYLLIEPEHVGALAPRLEDLSRPARGTLRIIQSQSPAIRGLRGRLKWMLKVGLGPAFNGQSVTKAGKEVLQASLHHFDDYARLDSSVLLGENLTDAALYRTMGEAFVAFLGWRERLSFDERPGGGSTTAQVFAKLVGDGKIVLAIADSDKKCPGDKVGGTAAKLLPVAKKALQHVHVLHVRSAENLISSTIYKAAFASAGQTTRLDVLDGLVRAEALPSALRWRDHAELKYGLTLFEVRTMTAKSAEAAFWTGVAADLKRDQCQEVQAASCGIDGKSRRCFVTEALGTDALDLAVKWMKPRDARRNADLLGIAPRTPTGDLCEKLLAWGIAPPAHPA